MKSIFLFLLFLSYVYSIDKITDKKILEIRYSSSNCKSGTENTYSLRDPCNIFSAISINSSGIYQSSKVESNHPFFFCSKFQYEDQVEHLGSIGECIKLDGDYPDSTKYVVYDPKVHSRIFGLSVKKTYHANSLCDNNNKFEVIYLINKLIKNSDGYSLYTVSSTGMNINECKTQDRNSCEQQDFFPFAKCLNIDGVYVSLESN